MSTASLTFLGHASFRLTLPDGRVILIDPWLSENPACPESERQQPRCDVVFLTHGHGDHTADVGALVEAHNPQVLAVFELANLLAARHPAGRFEGMGIGGTVEVQGIRFSLTRAYHSSSYQEGDHFLYAGMPGGVVVRVDGLATLYHAGDTDVFSDMQLIDEMYQPRVVLLPIGDHFTMGPRGAARAARYFDPQTIVPMHFATFPMLSGTPAALQDELGPDWAGRVLALQPGQTVTWDQGGLAGVNHGAR